VKATFGGTIGNLFLIDSVIAITVCSLAVHAGGIRMIFTMGRDNRLPAASAIARVHGKSKTPLIPSIVIGVITILLLVLNVGNQRAFFVLISVAIIMFYIAYLCVTGPLLIARLRGKWPTPEHGPYFSLGRWGLVVNVLAVFFQIGVMINLAWPRPAVYGAGPLVLPVGGVHLHRPDRRRRRRLLPGQAARPPGLGAGRAPRRGGRGSPTSPPEARPLSWRTSRLPRVPSAVRRGGRR
jgi:amino acid transporter